MVTSSQSVMPVPSGLPFSGTSAVSTPSGGLVSESHAETTDFKSTDGPTDRLQRPAAEYLRRLGACPESLGWVGERTIAEMWSQCEHPDWMLWLAARLNVPRAKMWEANWRACQVAASVFAPVWVLHAGGQCEQSGWTNDAAGLAVGAFLSSECCRARWMGEIGPMGAAAANVVRTIIPAEMIA